MITARKALVLGLLLAGTAAAQDAPPLLSFEGRLLRVDGTPETGQTTLTFRLYTQASGGNDAWSESQVLLLGAGGYYAVYLGALTPLPPFDGASYWLGVSVTDEPEMTPRVRMASVAYALRATSAARAGDAERLGGHASTEVLFQTSPLAAGNLTGTLAPERLPASVPLLTAAQLASAPVPPRVPLLDATGHVDASYLGSQGVGSLSESTDLDPGACLNLNHGFNSYDVLATAWARSSSGEPWQLLVGESGAGTDNLARGQPCTSQESTGWPCGNAIDGIVGTDSSNCYLANQPPPKWWQVDLGSSKLISRANLRPCTGAEYSGWDIQVSAGPTGPYTTVASNTCVFGPACYAWYSSDFTPVSARYVRIMGTQSAHSSNAGFTEIEILSGAAQRTVITLPSANQARLCNQGSSRRSFRLVVAK